MDNLKNQDSLILNTSKSVGELVEHFSQMQMELKEAMNSVDEITTTEVKTGFFRGLTGKTDADISAHVKGLGLNLRTTQKVVMFLMELSHAKNEVLRGFYDTLVNKLIELDKENVSIIGDLDMSQVNERKIICQIKDQIEGRLAIEDNIENNKEQIHSNKKNLINLSEELQEKSNLDDDQSNTLALHKLSIEKLSKRLNDLQHTIDNQSHPSMTLVNIYGVVSFIALSLATISFFNLK